MKKKVVILSAFATPFRSGAEACAEEVPARLQDQYEFTIVTARLRKDLPHLDRLPSGVKVWRVGIGRPIDKWLYPFLAPRAAKALQPDIIHAVLETFAGLALHFCKGVVPSAKRILTCQTTNRSFLKGMIVRSPHRVTVISSALQSIVKDLGRDDAVLIPNGIDMKLFDGSKEKIPGRILFVGRLEKMKGIEVLLTAFAKLKIENGELRIVGDGSQRIALETLSKDLGISDRVTFVGRIDPSAIASEYLQAEIFCGLSRSEALGNVFLEAQAAGCAVVATNVGGIPDIIKDGETGLLVPPNDIEAAANALERLLDDAALRQKLASNGQKNAAGYDWQRIAKLYAEVYAL